MSLPDQQRQALPNGPPGVPLLRADSIGQIGLENDQAFTMCYDMLFRKTVEKITTSLRMNASYEYLKLALIAVFVGLTYSKDIEHDPNFYIWIGVLAGTMISILPNQHFLAQLGRREVLKYIALQTGHILLLPVGASAAEMDTVYNAGAPDQPEPDSKTKLLLESQLAKTITSCLNTTSPCMQKLAALGELGLITCVIMLIVSLSKQDLPADTEWVTITYIVLECLVRIKYILLLLFIALIPLLCLGFCCFMCFCTKTQTAEKFVQGQPVTKYKMATDAVLQADCVICYMNFAEGEDIIRLPCSQKHFFHEFCIKQWLKLKTTCPICRHDFKDQ